MDQSRVPHQDPDRVATMYGELGNKLVRGYRSIPLLGVHNPNAITDHQIPKEKKEENAPR
jgi:hypothetical protein